jgi:uncharacterized heparinase superfamily protein
MLGPTTFVFLNQEGTVTSRGDWSSPGKPKLWLYNLHYFDDFCAEGHENRSDWHRQLISKWIAENPPSTSPAWDSYPTSLRIVNWIKWLLGGQTATQVMIDSLAVQSRWLERRLEHHILGNHLIANGKALTFSGLFFEGEEAARWYETGMKLLVREFEEQILADGGHFERSTMYHHIILEDVLDILSIHRAFGRKAPLDLNRVAERMLAWSAIMIHPDGGIAFFNDATFSIACPFEELVRKAQDSGVALQSGPDLPIVHLQDSGYVRLSNGDAVVLADIGPLGPDYLPAHGHADTLSFELSLNGRRVVVNGGTSLYGSNPERYAQRSTAAHATLCLDGVDSSEVWGSFRVARRARVSGARAGSDGVARWAEGSHDGYSRLPGRPLHHRAWFLEPGSLVVRDRVEGGGWHEARVVFPLGLGLVAHRDRSGIIRVLDAGGERVIAIFSFGTIGTTFIESANWHPGFGESVPTQRIGLEWKGNLPFEHETKITWSDT